MGFNRVTYPDQESYLNTKEQAVMKSIQNTFIQNSILNTVLSIQKWILYKRKYSVFE